MKAELYWIDIPWSGRLAIMPRPRGGDWLEDEVWSWQADGVDVVVSTLRNDEIAELDLAREEEFCRAQGMEYLAFPIVDRGVPMSAKTAADLVRQLESKVTEGKGVAIHCRQGVGRSALLAACLLALSGMDAETAFERIQQARSCPVPDTAEQREWVARFARTFAARRLSEERGDQGGV
jgi:protein-tyrosine phosphatase